MANELAIGLVIGATLKGVSSAFSRVTKLTDTLGKSISEATKRQERLGGLLSRGLAHPSRNIRQLSNRYHQLNTAIGHAEKSQLRLNKAIAASEKHMAKRQAMQSTMVEASAHAYAIGRPLIGSVRTFMEQEDAATNLKIAMLKANGTFGEFNEISKIADELGKDLPGTKKDFYRLAEAMKKQGISDQTLKSGGLKTSAKLNVLLEMDQFQGGEFFAKMLEAHGLNENELDGAADSLQRAMYAAGLNREQMYGAMTYYASNVRSMKLTGKENTEKLFAIQGMAGQQGLEGTSFGTNFSTMLDRMNKGPKMIAEAKKGMKAEAAEILEKSQIDFNFWDKKGAFKGIDGMMAELEKLEVIRQKFGDEGAGLVAEQLFGIEGKRIALLLAEKGSAGLEDFLQKMREQASLEERVALKTKTLSAAMEALGGVWESAVGTFGSAFAEDIKKFANVAQSFIENQLTPWLENNKSLVKTFVGVAAGFAGVKVGFLAIAYAANLLISPFLAIRTIWSKSMAVINLVKLTALSGGFVKLGGAIGVVSRATLSLGRALFMTPIGLIIGAIAGAAYLIWDNWVWIEKKFTSLGRWFEGVWGEVKNAFNQGISGIGALLLNWSPFGLVYSAFSRVLSWFGVDLPDSLTGAISAIWTSISAEISSWNPLAIFESVWNRVTNFFSTLWDDIKGVFGLGKNDVDTALSSWNPLAIISSVFNGVESVVSNAWNAAKNVVSSTIQSITNEVSSWDPVGAIGQAADSVGNFVSRSWDSVSKKASDLWGKVTGFFSSGSDDTDKVISSWNITQPFSSIWGNVSSFFSQKPAEMSQFGTDIVSGLVQGLQQAANLANEAIKSVATGISHTFKSNLDINSPSRVFMGFGRNTVEGLSIGMERSLPMAENASSQLGDIVTAPQAAYTPLNQQMDATNARYQPQSSMSIDFNPVININASTSSGIVEQVKQSVGMSFKEFERLLKRYQDQLQRKAY